MLLRIAPISAIVAIDGLDVPYETTISDQPHFFTYSIAHIEDFERHLLLLNVSNRSKLQVYLHYYPFPDLTNHYYPLGDVPNQALHNFFNEKLNEARIEVFED